MSCFIEMGRRCGVALGDRTEGGTPIEGGTRVNVHLRMKGSIGTHCCVSGVCHLTDAQLGKHVSHVTPLRFYMGVDRELGVC